MKTVNLSSFGISVTFDEETVAGRVDSNLERQVCNGCGQPDCCYQCDNSQGVDADLENNEEDEVAARLKWNGAVDAIESFILAAACAGIDIDTPVFLEAIESTFEAISNNVG